MKLNEIKQISVGGQDFYIKHSNRAVNAYLNRIEGSNSFDNLIQLFYDLAKVGAKVKEIEFNYTLEQFIEITDGDPDVATIFNDAYFGPGLDKKK